MGRVILLNLETNLMRTRHLLPALVLLAGLVACQKDEPQVCGGNYKSATVIQGRNGCEQSGFLLQIDGAGTLPPDGLPTGFQQQGLKVCLTYTTYEDLRMCPCCGGTRLRIVDIKRQ